MLNFIGKRKIYYIIALVIVIPGIFSLLFQGLNLGIDFTGGSILQVKFDQPADAATIREVVAQNVTQTPSIQASGDSEYLIRTVSLSEDESTKLISDLETKVGALTILRNEFIGPVIGSELLRNAIISLVIALILMLIYIAFRFKFNYGLVSIVTLFFDALVTVCIFSIFQFEVDGSFIAAVLTVIGYSINNTIVIFDRIRENLRLYNKDSFADIVDRSINQTLHRSINTVLAVLFPLVALILIGGATTKLMVLALMIGIVSGCYSSVCLAGPLLFEITDRKNRQKLKPAAQKAK